MANYYHLKGRRGTASAWASANPTPASGEICIEIDTGKIKIGDGVTAYTALSYFTIANATTSAAGLMSAADKTKLNGITISLYAKLASPTFTGTPAAPTPSEGDLSTKIATTEFVAQQVARTAPYLIRCEYSVGAAGDYQVINDITYCMYMAVNGTAVMIGDTQRLTSGVNYVDFLFYKADLLGWNEIPDYAFKGIGELTRAYLPCNIFKIGEGAFSDTQLQVMYCLSDTPPILGASVFVNTPLSGGGILHTHKDHLATYQVEWGSVGCNFDYIQ
jgi:hypothetical protein